MNENLRDERQITQTGITTADRADADLTNTDQSDASVDQRQLNMDHLNMDHLNIDQRNLAGERIDRDRNVLDLDPEQEQRSAIQAGAAVQKGREMHSAAAEEYEATPLFSPEESRSLYSRWDDVQVGFVDEPRHALEQADSLVASAIQRPAEVFAEERSRLEGQSDRGDHVSTCVHRGCEDVRLAFGGYRSCFSRLLSA